MPQQRMNTRDRLRAVEDSVQARFKRMRKRLLPILQTGIASGFAYWVSKDLIGHQRPFFAPISVVIIIGMTGGDRISKAWDIAVGCVLGVLIGDLFLYRLGEGGWQIALIVSLSLLIASFFSSSQLMNNQVAIGGILIATIMPPGAAVTGIDRTVDAFVGCAVALATLALIPQTPMNDARAEISKVMSLVSSVLDDVASGLRAGNPGCINEALDAIRGSQSRIDSMAAAIQSGEESTKLSPFLWGSRRYIQSMGRVIPPVDNAVRTTRVLARRALVLCEDGDRATEEQIELLDALSQVCLEISELYEVRSSQTQATAIPRLVNELRAIAQRSGMDALAGPGAAEAAPGATPAADAAAEGTAGNAAAETTPAAGTASAAAPATGSAAVAAPATGTTAAAAAAPGTTAETTPHPEPVLSSYALLAQTRSLTVDLLQICGMSRESALAALAPTSKTPHFEPETFDLG